MIAGQIRMVLPTCRKDEGRLPELGRRGRTRPGPIRPHAVAKAMLTVGQSARRQRQDLTLYGFPVAGDAKRFDP